MVTPHLNSLVQHVPMTYLGAELLSLLWRFLHGLTDRSKPDKNVSRLDVQSLWNILISAVLVASLMRILLRSFFVIPWQLPSAIKCPFNNCETIHVSSPIFCPHGVMAPDVVDLSDESGALKNLPLHPLDYASKYLKDRETLVLVKGESESTKRLAKRVDILAPWIGLRHRCCEYAGFQQWQEPDKAIEPSVGRGVGRWEGRLPYLSRFGDVQLGMYGQRLWWASTLKSLQPTKMSSLWFSAVEK